MKVLGVVFVSVVGIFAFVAAKMVSAQSPITFTNISDNRGGYSDSQIPKYEKFEVTFQIQNSVASNYFYPYDANAPAGVESGAGITVNATFTDPQGNTFIQPVFDSVQ